MKTEQYRNKISKGVLVVSGEIAVARLIAAILRTTNDYTVDVAISLLASHELALSAYDLIIYDVERPQINSDSLLLSLGVNPKVCCKMKHHPKILLMGNAFLEFDLFEKVCRMGIASYIRKPFPAQLLIAKVNALFKDDMLSMVNFHASA